MLTIRLQRTGRSNTPSYRIVVAEHSWPVKGKFLEILGHYLPTRTIAQLERREDRITEWISKGAIPSNTVARLLKKNGMKNMDKYIERYTKKHIKSEASAAPVAPAAAPASAAETKKEKDDSEKKGA